MPQDENARVLGDRLEILPVAPLLAESLRRIVAGESVAELFGDMNNK